MSASVLLKIHLRLCPIIIFFFQHERELKPKKLVVVRFLSLRNSMHSIIHNKEAFSVDVVGHIHAGGGRWGQVFYGVRN